MKNQFKIENRKIDDASATYFIADIGANHDGDLLKAKELIYMCADAGAEAAKFQHFSAPTIVSDFGFSSLPRASHQTSWSKSVFETYADASINLDWTLELKSEAQKAGIHFFSSPYSNALVDHITPFVDAIKIGSGDITWTELLEKISSTDKACILATGASTLDEVHRAVKVLEKNSRKIALLQCNTNYTGNSDNYRNVNLNVLKTYKKEFPETVLGLSDHTPGNSAVLGAITLGARIIEKHFTDDKFREGPDHGFALDQKDWREMVDRSRELELALGDGIKKVEDNEKETVVLQRRGIYLKHSLSPQTVIKREDIDILRPCLPNMVPANAINDVIGKTYISKKESGVPLLWEDIKN